MQIIFKTPSFTLWLNRGKIAKTGEKVVENGKIGF